MISEEDTTILQSQEAKLVHDSIKQLFPNLDDGIISDIEKVETTLDFKFSRDVIRFILHEHMSDIQWIPTGMFAQHDIDSPFTPLFKAAIKVELKAKEYKFHELYHRLFPNKSMVVEFHKEYCNLIINNLVSGIFYPCRLITLCAILGIFTGLSYLYGSLLAPYQSFLALIKSVKIIKFLKKVDDTFWNEIRDWLQSWEYESKRETRQALPNEYFRHDGMDIKVEMAVETTFEFKFGRDLIRFILQEYLTYLYWFPTGIFAKNDLDSPFTPQFKDALKKVLDTSIQKFQKEFTLYFPDKSKVAEIYERKCEGFKDRFVNEIFSQSKFIKFCAFLGISAGLAYYYGAHLAPYQSLQTLVTTVKELKCFGKFNDNLWNELQNCSERCDYDLTNEFVFKFGRDLIRFVLSECMTDLLWIPTGIFAENDLDLPFFPQFKKAIKKVLDSPSQEIQNVYDHYFPDKSKVPEIHVKNCKEFKETFVNGMFSPNIFINFCALLGMSAGLSYSYRAWLAPYQSLYAFLTAVKQMKSLGKVDDNLWNGLQDWLERNE